MSAPACRILFVGAVQEGRRCLDAMTASGERFSGIVTLPDSAAAKTSGAVSFDDAARILRVPLLKVRDLGDAPVVQQVRAAAPDLILAIGWTRLLPAAILKIPRLGCVGLHASLLPRYRGRAPVNWAIIKGETETGNTMFFLDEGVDTGDIIAQRRIPILHEDTCATVYDKAAAAAIEMLKENLTLLKEGRAPRSPQDHARATVMPKRRPEDGVIDWSRGARDLHNWVRALTHPYPGAFSLVEGRRLFVWEARVCREKAPPGDPGEVVGSDPAGGLVVATGDGHLALRRVQWESGSEVEAAALAHLQGRRMQSPARAA
jgi:methionyl-tRNA formyltransferase